MPGTTLRSPRLFALFAAGTALILTIPSAHAVLIAGDSFAIGTGGYAANDNLTGEPVGGTSPNSFGYSGIYGAGETGLLQASTFGLSSTALGYSGATGGSIRLASTSAIDGQSRSLTRVIANSASNPNTLYFSGLLQAPNAVASNRAGFFEFSNRTQPAVGGNILDAASEGFEFGIQGGAFVLRTAGGAAVETYSAPYAPLFGTTAATTNLFVLRLEINAAGDDLFTIYLNPTDVTSEAKVIETAAFKVTLTDVDVASSGAAISNSGFRTLGTTTDTTNIFADEVRVGTAFSDVVAAVPEPSLGTLLLAGVGVLAASRRRRATQSL